MDVNGCKLIWMFVPGHRVIWCLIWFIWHSRSNNPFNPFVHSNMSTTIVQLVEAPRRTPCRHCFSCRASTSPRSCDALVWSLVRCRVHVRYHEISTYPGIYHIYIYYSPPARWGLLDFIRAVLLILLLLLVLLLLLLLPPPPPPRPPPLLPPLPPLPRPLLPCQLLAKLFANFGAQCALLDLKSQIECQKIPDRMSDRMREDMPDKMP